MSTNVFEAASRTGAVGSDSEATIQGKNRETIRL
jgi:hypothetical protein